MKMREVVEAMVEKGKPSGKDVEDTILFLARVAIVDVRRLRRIVKELNEDLAYENSPVS